MTTETILYDKALKYVLDGTIDGDTDTLKVALLGSSYNPQPSATTWVAATIYALGMFVVVGGRFYEAIVGGMSSGATPDFPQLRGSTLVDNEVTWLCWGYSPPSSHSVFADVSANEITGTGYTAGGATLTGKTLTQTRHTVTYTADPVVWTGAVITMRYAVIYKAGTANALTNPLLAYLLLDSSNNDIVLSSAARFSLALPATGIFTLGFNPLN